MIYRMQHSGIPNRDAEQVLYIFPPYIKSWKWSKYNKDVNFRAMVSIIKKLARNFTANGCQPFFLWIWIDFDGNRIQARRIYKSIYTASDLLNNNFNLCHCYWFIFKVDFIFIEFMDSIILKCSNGFASKIIGQTLSKESCRVECCTVYYSV